MQAAISIQMAPTRALLRADTHLFIAAAVANDGAHYRNFCGYCIYTCLVHVWEGEGVGVGAHALEDGHERRGAGELGSWGAGELGSWGAGELGSWAGLWGVKRLRRAGAGTGTGTWAAGCLRSPTLVFCPLQWGDPLPTPSSPLFPPSYPLLPPTSLLLVLPLNLARPSIG
ncbi:hypothetical protein BDZ91DRAFT_817326 [Kalaharituber pfeilii]|nr:hypothetical protein BDZ91DRAFT_817326 [Kalaharituber pfeilii]